MKERAEQMFWVHTRGVIVTLPPDASASIGKAYANSEDLHHEDQRRLSAINNDGILKKRFPSAKDGEKYMNSVDMEWREVLYDKANLISTQIVEQAKAIGKEDFAILLFGSVAKGLTREKKHDDPSNIDLAVIGEFTDKEREGLLNRIRTIRGREEKEIGNNVGVFVQTPVKLRKSNYGTALMYIGSSARALYDPRGIWSTLEEEALAANSNCKKEKKQNGDYIPKWMKPAAHTIFQSQEALIR